MADLGAHGRNYRPSPYGQPTNHQRDAVYNEIFGGAPSGRSQTMTSRTPAYSSDRANTMGAHISPPQMQRPPAPVRQGPNDPYASGPNGYYHPHGHPNGTYPSSRPMQGPPLPQQPNRPPWPQPQRMDSKPSPMAQYTNPKAPMPQGRYNYFPPALNSNPDRTQSMANLQTPPRLSGPPMYQQPSSATTLRQQQYHHAVRTPQGRPVPERRDDERAMSLSSYSTDHEHFRTATGRTIPVRRPPSGPEQIPSQLLPAQTQQAQQAHQAQQYPPPVTEPERTSGHTRRRPSEASIASRTMSMASTVAPDRTMSLQSTSRPVSRPTPQNSLPANPAPARSRKPLVYPALLSRVADVFRERIPLGERQKNGLSYQNAFTGAEAVDLIAYIIKTADRNLALLLGRALDAQKFFHDVTYDHRLRDSHVEIYQFRETMTEEAPSSEVNGVFTLLTECYSPTCTRDNLCYSIACPRRLEQQARLNLKPQPGLRPSSSRGSLHGDDDQGEENQKLWINMVPKEVADSLDDREKKRQEIIFEIMYTERDFVKDLEYLRDFWMRPLRSAGNSSLSPIPEHRREKFIRTVFGNCLEVLKVNTGLAEALNARQKESHVVKQIGDIFLHHVPKFDPFIKYGANQLYGKYEFEKEKASNPAFARFVEETERLKESRKLELNGYLTKPTTRLARYPLLLEQVLKYTADDNPDKQDIPRAIGLIKDFLQRVNTETGKAENHFNLVQLNAALKFNPGDYVDLKLTEENRQMLTKMAFKKAPTDSSEVTAYLFDHAVLLVRIKVVNKREEYRVYRKPIPLELLVIAQMNEVIPRLGLAKRSSSGLIPGKTTTNNQTTQKELPITFRHLGKGGYDITLYATSQTQRKKFIEMVEEQQRKLRERNSNFYNKTILCEGFFSSLNRVNCLVPIDGGRKLVIGTDNGIYLVDRWPKDKNAKPRRVLDASGVTQIDTLEEYQLLLVLANKTLSSYPMEALEATDNSNPLIRRPKKIQGNANFFKAGIGLGRHLVCLVKTSALSTTIKVYELMDNVSKNKKKPALSKMFQGGQDTLKPFKEFYIPAESSSVHFLRSTLCVGCARGFELVSLETTDSQSLLDQADTSLDFVARKENVKPIHIERMNGEFLLNYSDFSFFVNRNGWRARPDWKISWEGTPNSFALSYPYILAFEPNFIEIRHIETSELIHILTGKNIRMLHSSTREILYAYEEEDGEDVVASLDFWNKPDNNNNREKR
ncbi:hypothetical protein VTN49DRAFT_5060 [Thermomyces lanuginosus]|uniref:uncharacterized protein n=1 Tax=Thermomyces lanuginosus TaxID=5541 RepID=UPI0037438C1A